MNKKEGHVFVWPIGTRIIHWLMALSFTAAFITSYYEYMLHDHVAFGFIFLTIIIYRIIWGLIGPEYARFVYTLPLVFWHMFLLLMNLVYLYHIHSVQKELLLIVVLLLFFLKYVSEKK